MPVNMALWPEEVIELNKELSNGLHEALEKKLLEDIGPGYGGENFFLERLGTIAAYCGIAIDGTFDSDQILAIVRVINQRLPGMRKRHDDGKPEIILPLTS